MSKKERLKDRLVKSADRVWAAYMKYGPVDHQENGDEFEAALLDLRAQRKRFSIQVRDERAALINILNALNGNPEPIHYKVRQAIEDARKVTDGYCDFDDEGE